MFVVAVGMVWLPRTMELHFPLTMRVDPVHLNTYTACFGLVSVICSPFWFSWYSWSLQEFTRDYKSLQEIHSSLEITRVCSEYTRVYKKICTQVFQHKEQVKITVTVLVYWNIQEEYKKLLRLLTTIHFLFCNSIFGGFLAAVAAPYLGAVVEEGFASPALTTEDARRPGFLCVFISSVTFLRPAAGVKNVVVI